MRSAPAAYSGDIVRAVIVGATIAGLFAAAFGIGAGSHAPSREPPAARKGGTSMTTGAIIFVPEHGDACRQSVIDNRTGEIVSQAAVSCKEVLAASARGGGGGSRIDIIRDSFRGSPP
jgi:hypothetical protein